MEYYEITGLVRRTVLDTITVQVRAKTEDEALSKAGRVFDVFPSSHGEDDVPYGYIENRENVSNELLALQEVKKLL